MLRSIDREEKRAGQTFRTMKSLILAQNERWWSVLYMQVERGRGNASRAANG